MSHFHVYSKGSGNFPARSFQENKADLGTTEALFIFFWGNWANDLQVAVWTEGI